MQQDEIMSCDLRSNNDVSTINLSGRFTFTSHKVFRDAYDQALARAQTRVIQLLFDKVEYLDSAALGMLLLLKERAASAGKKVQIKGAKGYPKQVLEIANFNHIFDWA